MPTPKSDLNPKTILSFANKLALHNKLTEVLEIADNTLDPPLFRYAEPWSDEKVAEHLTIHFPCTTHNVRGHRNENFGKLAPPLPTDYDPNLAALAKRVETLEQFNKDLIASYVKLLFIVNGLSPASITDEWALKQESKLHG